MTTNLRADRFGVLTASTVCHACGAQTPVSALIVPAFSERYEDEWLPQEGSALLIYIEAVDDRTLHTWRLRVPWMRLMASRTAELTYLANVCSCGALQGDHYLSRPNAPFFPLGDEGIALIEVEWVEEPIEAVAGTSQSSWINQLIERSPYPSWTPPALPKRRRRPLRSS